MEITFNEIDISRHLQQIPNPRPGVLEDLPHDVIRREPRDRWLVAHGAIFMDQPIAWNQVRQDENVLIPLFPYTLSPEPARALAYMLQLGCRVSYDVGRPVSKLHLSIGRPVIQFSGEQGDGWQYWAGIGLVTE